MSDWTSWIGRTTTSRAVLNPHQANLMAITLNREPGFADGDSLPPAWHWLFFHDLVCSDGLGADGHPALGQVMPPIPLEQRMWAGGSLRFSEPLRLGEIVDRKSAITSITPKQGRSGALFFVTVEHVIGTRDKHAIYEKQKIVYRALDSPMSGSGPAAPGDHEFRATWTIDVPTLFRYSALTFNAHRIHYDVDYAREIEGYRDLVVHGPLLATLLMDLAEHHGRPIHTFEYRAQSPLFVGDAFTTNGRNEGESTSLWVASSKGQVAMEATATCQRNGKR